MSLIQPSSGLRQYGIRYPTLKRRAISNSSSGRRKPRISQSRESVLMVTILSSAPRQHLARLRLNEVEFSALLSVNVPSQASALLYRSPGQSNRAHDALQTKAFSKKGTQPSASLPAAPPRVSLERDRCAV